VSAEVTVVIPTRGRWERLRSSGLRSCLGQQGIAFNVVVVDDGITDDTSQRVRALGQPHVTVVSHEATKGLSAARNTGVDATNTPWVAFLDDDDLWAPWKLSTQLRALRETCADFVYAAVTGVDDSLNVMSIQSAPDPVTLRSGLRRANIIPAGGSNVVARTSLIRRVGGFDERLYHLADWDMWLRLASVGRGTAVEEVLVGYVHHASNLQMRGPDPLIELERIVERHALRRSERRAAAITTARWRAFAHRRADDRRGAAAVYARVGCRYRSASDIARAFTVLAGERVMRAGPPWRPPDPAPPWLDGFRSSR
jgi:glycosyltransferase involved in cell wall biosynthesis